MTKSDLWCYGYNYFRGLNFIEHTQITRLKKYNSKKVTKTINMTQI